MKIDNGKVSTYLIGLVIVIQGFLITDPDLLKDLFMEYGIIKYLPLVLAILTYTYDYMNPRNSPQEEEIFNEETA